MRFREAWLWLIPLLLVGSYGGAVAMAYRNPPLKTCGAATNRPEGMLLMGVDLCNDGWWTVKLTNAHVLQDRQTQVTPYVSLAEENTVVLAANVATAPERHPHRTGELAGWAVPPTRPARQDRHGLRLEPVREPNRDQILVVQYTYLGWWPMTLRTKIDWLGSNRTNPG